MSAGTESDYERLRGTLNKSWNAVDKAKRDALEVREAIQSSLRRAGLWPLGSDTDIVVFGSLARLEWTSGSDVDWTLLIERRRPVLADDVCRLRLEVVGTGGLEMGAEKR